MTTYHQLRFLGKGGMGVVYEGTLILPRNQRLPVACKVMRGEISAHHDFEEMFVREAVISMRVANNHPGLVSVYHHFQDSAGRLHLLMELVRGCNLATLLQEGPLPFGVVRFIARRLLDTLAYLHRQEILHRDISPGNVLVSVDGDVKLSDLGLAKPLIDGQVETSSIPGKLGYASPEALTGDTVDTRADLYSLAAMLYEMAGTSPPFGRGRDLDHPTLTRRHEEWQIPALPETVPADLRDLIMGLLQKDPDERRPRSAAEALREISDAEDTATRDMLARLVGEKYAELEAARKTEGPQRTQQLIVIPDIQRGGGTTTMDPFATTDVMMEEYETTASPGQPAMDGLLFAKRFEKAEPEGMAEAAGTAGGQPADAEPSAARSRQTEPARQAPRSRWLGLVMVAMLLGLLAGTAVDRWWGAFSKQTIDAPALPADDRPPALQADTGEICETAAAPAAVPTERDSDVTHAMDPPLRQDARRRKRAAVAPEAKHPPQPPRGWPILETGRTRR